MARRGPAPPPRLSPATCLVLATHSLAVDLEVQLPHAADDGLANVRIIVGPEGRVLALEPDRGGTRELGWIGIRMPLEG